MGWRNRRCAWFLVKELAWALATFVLGGRVAVACVEFPPSQVDDPSNVREVGYYNNCLYGFSVVIPSGLQGWHDAPPARQEGIGIVLSRGSDRGYIAVLADPNSAEYRSAYHATRSTLEICKTHGGTLLSAKRTSTKINGFPAARVIVHCRCVDGEVAIDSFFVLHPRRQVVYEIALYSAEHRYPAYRKVFEEIVKTWQLKPRSCW